MGKPNKMKLLDEKVKLYHSNNLSIYLSKPTYLEIMSNNVTKTSAIEILMRKFNIQRSERIFIEDNFNDIDMIDLKVLVLLWTMLQME